MAGTKSDLEFCLNGDTTTTPDFALIGDSHANAISHELDLVFKANKASFLQYTKQSCPAIIDFHDSDNKDCGLFMENVIRDIAERNIKNVMLMNYWGYYLNSTLYQEEPRVTEILDQDLFSAGDTPLSASQSFRQKSVLYGYEQMVDYLNSQGINVFIFLPNPSQNSAVLDATLKMSTPSTIVYPKPLRHGVYLERNKEVLKLFKSLAESKKITLLGNIDALCPGTKQDSKRVCLNNYLGQLLYLDSSHLTNAGARLFLKGTENTLFGMQ